MRELIAYIVDNTDLSNRQIMAFIKGFAHLNEESELMEDIAFLNSCNNTKPDLEDSEAIFQIGKVMSVLI